MSGDVVQTCAELVAVREELAKAGQELVGLLANRMRLIREVARVKAEKESVVKRFRQAADS